MARERETRLAYSTAGETEPEAARPARHRARETSASGSIGAPPGGWSPWSRASPATAVAVLALAKALKAAAGAGGTVKDGALELQGDHRTLVEEALRARRARLGSVAADDGSVAADDDVALEIGGHMFDPFRPGPARRQDHGHHRRRHAASVGRWPSASRGSAPRSRCSAGGPSPSTRRSAPFGARGDRPWPCPATSAIPSRVRRAFDEVERQLGPVNQLVNNAAGNFLCRDRGPLPERLQRRGPDRPLRHLPLHDRAGPAAHRAPERAARCSPSPPPTPRPAPPS